MRRPFRSWEDRRSDPLFVGVASSILLRRYFAKQGRRAVTAYVEELFGGRGNAFGTRRTAELLIRTELGELDLLGDLPTREVTFEVAAVILDDLVGRLNLGGRTLSELISVADRESRLVEQRVVASMLSPRRFLRRALRRRSGSQ